MAPGRLRRWRAWLRGRSRDRLAARQVAYALVISLAIGAVFALLQLLQGLLANDPGLRPTAQAAWLLLQEPGMLPPGNAHFSADES